jgi:hypothetical protein
MRFGLLQHMIRRAPTDRRDPMRLFADRPHPDEAIDKLFGAQGGMAGFDRSTTFPASSSWLRRWPRCFRIHGPPFP